MNAAEFSRTIAIDIIGETPRTVSIEADEAERAALARRFGLRSIGRLKADAKIALRAGAPVAEGRIVADVVQNCVVTDDPLPATIDESFTIRFVPEASAQDVADEVELSADECDTVFYAGGAIDLGETAAETMALALDPFPRGPNADAALRDAGVIGEHEAGPFGALKALKDRLEGKG